MDSKKVHKEIVPFIRPYFDIDEKDLFDIKTALESGQVTNNGPKIREFERLLAGYLETPEVVAVSNGSDALLLALKALNLRNGKAILPAYTYISTLNAVVHSGLTPIFCDIDLSTFTMDPEELRQLLEQHQDVKCVLPVNVFGVAPQLETIYGYCEPKGIKVVYDNAHGFGSTVNGEKLPKNCDIQTFSLHATKALPAIEGGLIVSQDPDINSRLKRLRTHGTADSVLQMEPGYNSKMDELRAIVGIRSLENFTHSLSRRLEYGQRFRTAFQNYPEVYDCQKIPENVITNFQNMGVRIKTHEISLEKIIDAFQENGIAVKRYFDPPLNRLSGYHSDALPITEEISATLLAFPIHSRMTEETLQIIENAISVVAKKLCSRQ
jgi:dTDP-4-amino-4,6-dideoxygalactose transaminase